MWTLVASFFGKIFSALIGRWLVRREAKKEVAAEIKQEDRKKANEIRDRVDNAKSTGRVRPKPDDSRGYRD
jgi:hypothetical protein